MRRLLAALLAVLFLVPIAPVGAETAVDPVRIAVIDTGINATHPEFLTGQVVAWKDFTEHNSPVPVDKHGHGTATASLVAGQANGNCGPTILNQRLSFAPGADLIIARVGNDAGTITGSIEAAVRWSVAQGADVISMSIGGIVPIPLGGSQAIAEARAAGVLMVVSAGNGLANAGVAPYPGWSTTYGNDLNVISVGGGSRSAGTLTSTTGNMDPDVTSWSDGVCVANTNGGYVRFSGTSFSAPLVAGMAAKAVETARANGQDDSPDRIERLLLLSATNSIASPYAREGMGWLLTAEAPVVYQHAAAGTWPNYDAQGQHAVLDRMYHDSVVDPLFRGLQP